MVAGFVVVGIGLFLLAAQVVPDVGQWIPLAIGLVFIAAFVGRREYGFLIPGSILAGIGVGVILANVLDGSLAGPAVVLSLAGGFVAIWVVSSITGIGPVDRSADGTETPAATWWPLIPGGILGLVGAVLLADADAGGILRWWPVAIVALGLVILARAMLEQRRRS